MAEVTSCSVAIPLTAEEDVGESILPELPKEIIIQILHCLPFINLCHLSSYSPFFQYALDSYLRNIQVKKRKVVITTEFNPHKGDNHLIRLPVKASRHRIIQAFSDRDLFPSTGLELRQDLEVFMSKKNRILWSRILSYAQPCGNFLTSLTLIKVYIEKPPFLKFLANAKSLESMALFSIVSDDTIHLTKDILRHHVPKLKRLSINLCHDITVDMDLLVFFHQYKTVRRFTEVLIHPFPHRYIEEYRAKYLPAQPDLIDHRFAGLKLYTYKFRLPANQIISLNGEPIGQTLHRDTTANMVIFEAIHIPCTLIIFTISYVYDFWAALEILLYISSGILTYILFTNYVDFFTPGTFRRLERLQYIQLAATAKRREDTVLWRILRVLASITLLACNLLYYSLLFFYVVREPERKFINLVNMCVLYIISVMLLVIDVIIGISEVTNWPIIKLLENRYALSAQNTPLMYNL
uniref:F-box domain-containing protein n=1 Tax=Panagrellus redivivus TaxID=6233 RepID=A0A7E4ZRE6_PANRE